MSANEKFTLRGMRLAREKSIEDTKKYESGLIAEKFIRLRHKMEIKYYVLTISWCILILEKEILVLARLLFVMEKMSLK